MNDQMNPKLQEVYCLKWSNYPADVANIFLEVLHSQFMVDVTVCAEGREMHAHRIVLSACSPFLQEILSSCEEKHPVIILSEITFEDLKSIIEFMYQGEVTVGGDRIISFLNAAEELHIIGLMGIRSHFIDTGDRLEMMMLIPEVDIQERTEIRAEPEKVVEQNISDDMEGVPEGERKRKCRRKSCRKDYSEESLSAALEELKAGRSLVGTASAYHIPRSTLYVRARSQGIKLSVCRQGHAGERVQEAIKAVVTDGASLQKASEQFNIPKTVLWRNVHKKLGTCSQPSSSKFRKAYDEEKRRAAIKALEQGGNLAQVSHQFQIPKTTLFREKTRLVETGKLPWSCLKRRGPQLDGFRKNRLREAVAACKDGKMSQALASVTFQVPKTTIWRRLREGFKARPRFGQHREQDESGDPEQCDESTKRQVVQDEGMLKPHHPQVEQQIPVTYIQGSELGNSSLIILATSDSKKITVEEGSQVIVETSASEHVEEKSATTCNENIACVDNRNMETVVNENVETAGNNNVETVVDESAEVVGEGVGTVVIESSEAMEHLNIPDGKKIIITEDVR